MIYQADERKKDGLASTGLDDGGLANAGGVEVDVRAFLSCLSCDVEVQYLYDIADKVR